MSFRPRISFMILNLGTLRLAALLIPERQRAEWLKEWQAELWHVRQVYSTDLETHWQAEQKVAAFYFGSFQDAFCLRQYLRMAGPPRQYLSSATQCIWFLAALALMTCCIFMFLPGAHITGKSLPYRNPQDLILITRTGFSGTSSPTIRAEQFRAWRAQKQPLFSDFAFYQPIVKSITLSPHHSIELNIARSSPNLFGLLGLPIQFLVSRRDLGSNMPGLVITDETRQKYFGGDHDVSGRVLQIGVRKAEVVGVVPAQLWRLPGHIDAWLLEPDEDAAAIPENAQGFLIGYLASPLGYSRTPGHWNISVATGFGGMDYLTCDSLASRAREPFDIFLFTVILAFLALPATTSLPLGEYSITHHKLSWSKRFHRWIFLASKIVLILPIVYFGSLDLAHLSSSITPGASEYIQIVTSFCACLFGLRWTLRDQRKRCPVCLGKLTNPARVGQPSRTFLAWNGTELICTGGHGLLHVPEMPTSWFSTQRWLYLDPSWDVLFPTGI